jgi:hypothetical protein
MPDAHHLWLLVVLALFCPGAASAQVRAHDDASQPSWKISETMESAVAQSLRTNPASRHLLGLGQNPPPKQRRGPSISGIIASAVVIAGGAYFYDKGSRNSHLHYLSGPPWVECRSEPQTTPRPPNIGEYPNTDSACGSKGYRTLGLSMLVLGGLGLIGSLF